MRELSIHVDESGDFGDYSAKFAPYYIFTLVFHEQENDISGQIKTLDREMANLDYFFSFDRIVLYYDNGQPTLSRTLLDVFQKKLTTLHRKPDVHPYNYKLLQVADMICTLRLLEIKAENNELTKSEICVFHSARDLKKEFIKKIKEKEFKDMK